MDDFWVLLDFQQLESQSSIVPSPPFSDTPVAAPNMLVPEAEQNPSGLDGWNDTHGRVIDDSHTSHRGALAAWENANPATTALSDGQGQSAYTQVPAVPGSRPLTPLSRYLLSHGATQQVGPLS